MTTQFDFTNAEWSDIAVLPVLLGYAIAQAEDSGMIGDFFEIRTLVHAITEEAPHNAARSLIEAAGTIDVKAAIEGFEEHGAELLGDVAVASCSRIARVLDDRAQPDEARDYKSWIMHVATEVANAASEDGVRVSDAESTLLGRARTALGIQSD